MGTRGTTPLSENRHKQNRDSDKRISCKANTFQCRGKSKTVKDHAVENGGKW